MTDITVPLPDDATPQQLLAAAADLMAARGKCEDDYTDGEGRVCALGALRLAAYGDPEEIRFDFGGPYWAARELLAQRIGGVGIPFWSDSSDQDEVVATLRTVAAQVTP